MRIFFITHTYSLEGGGGGEVFVSSYLRELRKRGHEIFVFTPKTRDFSEQEKKLGIKSFCTPVFFHNALHKFEYVLFSPIAVFLALKFKPDVIHAQNDAFPGIIGCIAKFFTGKPLVVAVEGISDKTVSLNSKIIFGINRLFLPILCYDKIVSWSEFVKNNFFIKWKIPGKKIEVIPGGIEMGNFLNAKPSSEFSQFGEKFFLSAKPLHKTNAEAISFVIKAMQIVSKKHPDFRYVIAGEGSERQNLESLAKKLGLEKKVLFAGWIDSKKLPSLYASADFIVHSFSFKASTSIALIESMAAGKAIVATGIGEIENTVKGSAVLVEPENPESIAGGILKLIDNPGLKKSLGIKAREIAEKNYSIQAIADKFEQLYDEIMLQKK